MYRVTTCVLRGLLTPPHPISQNGLKWRRGQTSLSVKVSACEVWKRREKANELSDSSETNRSHQGWVNTVCRFSRTHGMKIHKNRHNYCTESSCIQTHTSRPKSLCDIIVCVTVKWLWQVVFAQTALSASVPHSASLVEFLWELMGRSGRGSQTSAVCESDRADNVEVWTGQARRKGGSGSWSRTPDLSAHDLMRKWGWGGVCKGIPAGNHGLLLPLIKGLLLVLQAYKHVCERQSMWSLSYYYF